MSRFNFTELVRNIRADILDVKDNFDKIEEIGVIVDDLPKTKAITISANNWVTVTEDENTYYTYTINDSIIQSEPYDIEVIFNDLTLLEDVIYPKANSQAVGSIILETTTKPNIDLAARLIVTKGVQQ